jgi:SAM-dependent methyltransferase
MEINRGLPVRMLLKYFVRDGDEWEVTPELRSICEFQCANLCAPLPRLPAFDLVLLRNVLLYFPQQDRNCVFTDVYRQMTPGGYLMLGSAEQAEDSTNLSGGVCQGLLLLPARYGVVSPISQGSLRLHRFTDVHPQPPALLFLWHIHRQFFNGINLDFSQGGGTL